MDKYGVLPEKPERLLFFLDDNKPCSESLLSFLPPSFLWDKPPLQTLHPFKFFGQRLQKLFSFPHLDEQSR